MINHESVDLESEEINPKVITHAHKLAAMGLDHLEQGGRYFYAVNATPTSGEQLADVLGEGALLVDGSNFWPDVLDHEIEIVGRDNPPCRVIFYNMGQMHDKHAYNIEELLRNEAVKSFWFMQDPEGSVRRNIREKILLRCIRVDAPTLLDAIAFGWKAFGTKNISNGNPTPPPDVD